jgi:hypothetical protein
MNTKPIRKTIAKLIKQVEELESQQKKQLRSAKPKKIVSSKTHRPPGFRAPKITQKDYEHYISTFSKPNA